MKKPTKEYIGSAYIGVVGADLEYGMCRDSIENLTRRTGDSLFHFGRATKGYEARQKHLSDFYHKTNHEFLFLMDQDMVFPADALEKLRSHKLPYLSGYYLRRTLTPPHSVWYKPMSSPLNWPMTPWFEDPELGILHPIGASGWGCLLVHRDVITATRQILKGEPEIIEDDLDILPYDTLKILSAIRGLRTLSDTKPNETIAWPALEHHLKIIESEFRIVRGSKDPVGSDLRFPFYARAAGYQLYGDPDVRCAHVLDHPLHPDQLSNFADEAKQNQVHADKEIAKLRTDQRRVLKGLGVL
jgi:hypothetical protein